MKKIGKISINPEKVIKSDELVNLRGGYSGTGDCYYLDYQIGSAYCPDCEGTACLKTCKEAFPDYYVTMAICTHE